MQGGYSHIVLGLGATGLSVVRYLVSQGIKPLVMDSRRNPPGAEQLATEFADVELLTGGFDCRHLVQASQVIVSPGIALDTPEVRAVLDMGIEVIGDIELFARDVAKNGGCVIGITGSNGKSTVTTLVRDMLVEGGKKAVMGGNIGTPALDLLNQGADCYVLELSSFQLETTHSLCCTSAVCLNISEDHMDRYSDINAYRDAKLRLYPQSRYILFNRDDELTKPDEPMNQNSFGLQAPEEDEWGVIDGKIYHCTSEIMPLDEIGLIGTHNHMNVMASMALVEACGVDRDAMIAVAKRFKGLPHRCELVAEKNGVYYINDSKATNVGATVAAIEGFDSHLGDIYLIAGGDGKGADFTPLQPALDQVSQLITLGKDGDKIAKLKQGTVQVETMAQAVEHAAEEAMSGDIVILSPACASLDMYSNFMARGQDFSQCVEHIGDGEV
ncbi:UDP-N-acetylmuramoyl-L-alanine--D-glutamate ligase [Shewanella sp. WXL01]|uniref:UDP-N-acetylmuramoyl-L-alanine--D-glutamate ligase n=1 Tax=Shewanella sp. WXL01 TaxID=2709721 RepID=UPI0014383FBB|nr:UDP-N-acetylmuramoyl-L-alanine--D-glutamate ligase [Shewanella sp. WXL01]NKF52362.1 UDP-N-acetylmuramoyl-L-alanine--D-glutamate ligase [Shewanella sp. WXL01]